MSRKGDAAVMKATAALHSLEFRLRWTAHLWVDLVREAGQLGDYERTDSCGTMSMDLGFPREAISETTSALLNILLTNSGH